MLLASAGIDGIVLLLAILPLLLTAHVPLGDLPGHLARQYVLRDWASSPVLQSIYQIHWAVVPNLALDLFVAAVRQILPLDFAMRLFCICSVALLFFGTRLINLALSDGRGRAYRIVPFLTYGGAFQHGFLSYAFGVGLALLWFGYYVRLTVRGRQARAFLLMIGGITTWGCHMAAFGLFALAVGSCELARAFRAHRGDWRGTARQAARALLLPVGGMTAVVLVLTWLGPPESPNSAVRAAVATVHFDFLRGKLQGIYAITGFSSRLIEGGLLVLGLTGLALALACRAVRINDIGATAVTAMVAAWLVLPNVALGAAYIDYRLPWAIAFFAVASLVPDARGARFRRSLALYAAALTAARIAAICAFWLAWEPVLAQIDQALAKVPVGTRLFAIKGEQPNHAPFHQPELEQVASYVVARRQGFEPKMFVGFPGQILDLQPEYEQMWVDANMGAQLPTELDRVPPGYDYVLVLLPDWARLSPDLPLRCAASGRVFDLYEIRSSAETDPGPLRCPRPRG